MPFDLETFVMAHIGDVVNLVVCGAVFLVNLVFGGKLAERLAEETKYQPEIEGWEVFRWSFSCWTYSWLFWFGIYAARLCASTVVIPDTYASPVILLLCDLNSAYLFHPDRHRKNIVMVEIHLNNNKLGTYTCTVN